MQQGAEPANSVGRVAPSASEPERRRILIDAAKQVGPALLFSLVIIVVSFLPVFLLEAQEGRVFKPLAWTKTIVVFDEEEITEEILQNRVKDITGRIDELEKHYKKASQLAGRLPTIPAKEKAREYSRCRCGLGREIVRISLIVRNLGFTNFERKRPINRINTTMDTMCSLDRQVSNLEKKIENTRS